MFVFLVGYAVYYYTRPQKPLEELEFTVITTDIKYDSPNLTVNFTFKEIENLTYYLYDMSLSDPETGENIMTTEIGASEAINEGDEISLAFEISIEFESGQKLNLILRFSDEKRKLLGKKTISIQIP